MLNLCSIAKKGLSRFVERYSSFTYKIVKKNSICIFLFCFASAKVAEAGKRQNLKKESKAYSYEDQIWEMEVREVTLSPDFYATRFQWMVSQLLISESLRGMGMSFGCSGLWDRLGWQALVMIGQFRSRQPLTNHKYHLFTQSIPELTALKACTHSHYSFWNEKLRLPCILMSPISALLARTPLPLSSPRLHADGTYNRRQNCRDIVLK